MSKLLAGACVTDITPNIGHNLSGWQLRREAKNCITPLLARTLVLDNGDMRIIVITCDLLAVQEPLSGEIRAAAANAAGTKAGHVFIFPAHNHYAADVSPKFFTEKGIQTPMEKEYVDALPGKIAACAKEASEKMTAVLYGHAFGSEDSVLINDRFRRKDGLINWVGDESLAVEKKPADTQLSVISFADMDRKPVATIYHYGCHPNCGEKDGRDSISWDWCGYASKFIEEELGGEAFFILGPCGDVHPRKYGIAKEMGEKVGRAAVSIAKGIGYTDTCRLAVVNDSLKLKRRDFTKYDRTQIHDFCSQVPEADISQQIEEVCNELVEEELRKPAGAFDAKVSALLLGDMAVSCIPGELFVEPGMEIKRRSPVKPVIVAEIVNDWISYLPAARDYAEGGYQVGTVTKVEAGSAEAIVEKSLECIGKLK